MAAPVVDDDEDDDPFAMFGSDDDDDGEGDGDERGGDLNRPCSDATAAKEEDDRDVTSSCDAAVLHATRTFLDRDHGGGPDGTRLNDRVFALHPPPPAAADGAGEEGATASWRRAMLERLSGRGIQISTEEEDGGDGRGCWCDGAALFCRDGDDRRSCAASEDDGGGGSVVRRGLVPGGTLFLFCRRVASSPTVDGEEESSTRLKPMPLSDLHEGVWDVEHARTIHESATIRVIAVTKRPCPINAASCPWMPSSTPVPRRALRCLRDDLPWINDDDEDDDGATYLNVERRIVSDATVSRTVYERRRRKDVVPGGMTKSSVRRAVASLRKHGFVVLRDVFDPKLTTKWGRAALEDFDAAVKIIRERTGTDVADPGIGGERGGATKNYREMATREDFRVDLRDGPKLRSLRIEENRSVRIDDGDDATIGGGVAPAVVDAAEPGDDRSIRYHPGVLAVVRAAFNPRDGDDSDLYRGNFGRYNFDGSGPDGSPQPLRVGQIGSVISLPGAADQAVHADAPHLFEHVRCLPVHYANLFAPGTETTPLTTGFDEHGNFAGETKAGGTAFVAGSHDLAVSKRLTASGGGGGGDDDDERENGMTARSAARSEAAREEMNLRTVRPSLLPGDAAIFDCRVLHFGLANDGGGGGGDGGGGIDGEGGKGEGGDANGPKRRRGGGARRPMLYVNYTHAWFHDPKNWDDRERIFKDL